jgi:MFS family permease
VSSARSIAGNLMASESQRLHTTSSGLPKSRVVRVALKVSLLEGGFACVALALVMTFAVPAIIALGGAEMGVGVLTGLYALSCGLTQLIIPSLAARLKRRRTIVICSNMAQGMACLLFASAGYFSSSWSLTIAVSAYALFGITGSIGFSPWASWMSDLVPKGVRSKHFAYRSVLLGAITGGTALYAGFVLRWSYGGRAPWVAFAFIFSMAALYRLLSGLTISRQFEPLVRQRPPLRDFSYWKFLSKVGRSNFANFTLCFALLHAGANLSGPFFSLFFLRDLGYGYGMFALLMTTALSSSIFFVRFWGRVARRWGNRLVLWICAIGLAMIPLLYIFSTSLVVFFIAFLIGGCAWAGINLASFNYVMEAATPPRRIRCYGYMMGTMLLAVAIACLGGGWIAPRLPHWFAYPIQSIFLLSIFVRIAAAACLFLFVKELSAREKATAGGLFWELPMVRSTAGVLRFIANNLRRI